MEQQKKGRGKWTKMSKGKPYKFRQISTDELYNHLDMYQNENPSKPAESESVETRPEVQQQPLPQKIQPIQSTVPLTTDIIEKVICLAQQIAMKTIRHVLSSGTIDLLTTTEHFQ